MHYSVTSPEARRISRKGSILRKRTIGLKYLSDKNFHFSVVISRKQGNSVERNRVKRIIREMVRATATRFPKGHYLIYYRGQCATLDKTGTAEDLNNILQLLENGQR